MANVDQVLFKRANRFIINSYRKKRGEEKEPG